MKSVNNNKDLRVQRTNYLLNKALFELLTKKSFDDINVTDICEEAMVHRATFYKHFSDKFDLANNCIEKLKDDFFNVNIQINNNNIQEYYLNVLDNMLTYINDKKVQLKGLFDNNKEGYIYLMIIETLSKNIKVYLNKCMEHKLGNIENSTIPQEIKVCFLSTGITSLAIWWLNEGTQYTKDQMLQFFQKLVMNNIN